MMLTAFGAGSVTLMMLFYAFESRGAAFTLLFAIACFAASAYGWLAGTWPFGVVELAWGFVALWRWKARRANA
jgi:hypothetical protein